VTVTARATWSVERKAGHWAHRRKGEQPGM